MSDPADLGATQLAALIRERRLSALEAVDAHLGRIEARDAGIRAFVVRRFEAAREEAGQADAAGPEARARPLHGVPVSVKECFDLAGTPSTAGITPRAGHRAAADAEAVRRLRQAGAIVLGKTNVPQYLLYVETDNPLYGRTNNPWDLERSPGGSSGGEAAALAAGFSSLGLGTDIGGSVRAPAHACGTVGFKPAPGAISLAGTVDAELFAHVRGIPDAAGPMARSVADIRTAMAVLGDQPIASAGVRGLAVGVYERDGYFPSSPALARAVREAAGTLRAAGVEVVEFSPPAVEEAMAVFYGLFTSTGDRPFRAHLGASELDGRIQDLMQLASMPRLARPPLAALMGLAGQREVAALLRVTGPRREPGVQALLERRDAYRRRFAEQLQRSGLDALLGPASALPALTHGATRHLAAASTSYTALYNLLAWPAGVVPVTTVREEEQADRPASRDRVHETARRVDEDSAGLPVAVQVAAPPGREAAVLDLMEAIEAGAPRDRLRPPAPGDPGAR